MKYKLFIMIIALALALTACATQPDYERLPLKEYNFNMLNFSQQEIDDYFQQLIADTPQARNMAYTIHLTLKPNGFGNITGDFAGIENAPMDKLIEQAIFTTPAIDLLYYSDVQEYYVENNIVSITFEEAIKDGKALGDIFYADDIEQTLVYLYGEYPVAGESYRDHFTDADHIEYYPEEGLFLQRFDWGGSRSIPQILALQETAASIVCDFVTVTSSQDYDRYYYEVEYGVELTPDNFVAETANLDVLRFTYHYAEDDGRPILYSVEKLGKMGRLLHAYGLEEAIATDEADLDLGISELLKNYIAGIEQKNIAMLKPLFTEYCAFRENAPVSGTDITNDVMRAIYDKESGMFEEAKRLYDDIDNDVYCTFMEFFIQGGYLRYHFLFKDDVEYEYKETRFLDYEDDKGNIYGTIIFICHDDSEVEGWLFHHLTIANINGSYKIVYAETDI